MADSAHAAIMRRWITSPLAFVEECLRVEPDAWQRKALETVRHDRKNLLCMQACVGPGKSCVLAWLGWWWLATQARKGEPHKGCAVAVTGDNLRMNLWPELRKWQEHSPLLMSLFTWTRERIVCNESPETWFLAARQYAQAATPEEAGRTLSGLHCRYPLILLDESGDMPPAVGRAAIQALSTCDGGLIAQAGNPTSQAGLLYDSSVVHATQWDTIRITSDPRDPDRTPRVSKEWAQEQIDNWGGRDNPWVQYAILGQFPPAGFAQLIGPEEVTAAMRRRPLHGSWEHAGLVTAVDVALDGMDSSVIMSRQGINAALHAPRAIRNGTGATISAVAAECHTAHGRGVIVVDNSGGYGAGTYDALYQLDYNVHSFKGSEKATDPRYFNKRAECYWKACEWIRAGGCLPDCPALVEELCAHEMTTKDGRFLCTPKEVVKKRIGRSPDHSDALSMLFAVNPASRDAELLDKMASTIASARRKASYADYDPHARARARGR